MIEGRIKSFTSSIIIVIVGKVKRRGFKLHLLNMIEKNQWEKNEKGMPVELCVIDVSNVTLDVLNIDTESKYKEVYTFYFSVNDCEYKIKYRWDINGTKSYLFVYMHSNEGNPRRAIDILLSALGLNKNLILFENQEFLQSPKFQVMRLDDNSNDVEITCFHQRATAEFYAKTMEAKGHKQLYYVQKI